MHETAERYWDATFLRQPREIDVKFQIDLSIVLGYLHKYLFNLCMSGFIQHAQK